VELLVVIAIIGVLVSLLLPAVNSAREAARRLQCSNKLRQIGLAAINHESSIRYFPTGGWGLWFVGDPNRGFGEKQPGSWIFCVLPYLEEQALHDKGLGLSGNEHSLAVAQMNETPLSAFNCPSRRPAVPYPTQWGSTVFNAPRVSSLAGVAKSDYAANAGDGAKHSGDDYFPAATGGIPRTYEDADDPNRFWVPTNVNERTSPYLRHFCSGVSYFRSEVKVRQVKDGLSKTYFAAEKYVNPEAYDFSVLDFGENQSAYTGFEWDNHRLTQFRSANDRFRPMQDRRGVANWDAFGSAHAAGFNAVLCDNAVMNVSYQIDREVHRRLGNRLDGLPVNSADL
jgi:type II secretory pathway pseudopilin PulG